MESVSEIIKAAIIYTAVKDSGVQLAIRYLCEPKNRWVTQQMIREEGELSFAKNTET